MKPDPIAAYLRKRADLARWPLSREVAEPVDLVIVIPCLAERATLFDTLADLSTQPSTLLARTLVLCVLNNRPPGVARAEDIAENLDTLAVLSARARELRPLRAVWVDAASPGRELPAKAGVGLARKIGLDWAAHLLHQQGRPGGGMVCLDADTRVDADYLPVLHAFFEDERRWGAVLDYAHPLDVPETRAAILCYELFLRYHELGLCHAGSPYAFPTLGSAMACTPRAYAAVSGMNQRQAGEDFYFLQELAKTGDIARVAGTTVHPSARASHRVPFGTGRRVQRFIGGGHEEYQLYHPASYEILGRWLSAVAAHLASPAGALLERAEAIAPCLRSFLEAHGFAESWTRLQRQAPTPEALLCQFHRWFDAFRTLKLIHYLRENAHPDLDMAEALRVLLAREGGRPAEISPEFRTNLDAQARVLMHLRRRCTATVQVHGAGTLGVPSP